MWCPLVGGNYNDDFGFSPSSIDGNIYNNYNNITKYQTQTMWPRLSVKSDSMILFTAETETASSIAFYGYSNYTETLLAPPQQLTTTSTNYNIPITNNTDSPYDYIYFELGMYVNGTFTVETGLSATVKDVRISPP